MIRPAVHVILLAGGTGSRFDPARPKQFTELLGESVLSYSLKRFSSWLNRLDRSDESDWRAGCLVLVSHAEYAVQSAELVAQCLSGEREVLMATGGSSRHRSSINGVRLARDTAKALRDTVTSGSENPNSATGKDKIRDVYLIHDTARPFVPLKDLDALLVPFRGASPLEASPAASSLVCAASETLVEGADGRLIRGIDRSQVYAVKTPQALSEVCLDLFLSDLDRPEFTDLLRWAEFSGYSAALVEGSPLNIKLTTAEDRILLEAVLRSEQGRL